MTNFLSIKFTRTPIYIKYNDLAVEEAKNLVMSKGVDAIPNRLIKTPNVNTCTVIALFSKLKNKLFHIAPELETAQNVKNKLAKEIKELQSSSDKDVKALIIGGLEPKIGDAESGKSQEIYNAAAEVAFDDFGLDGIMLCGKKRNASMESIEIQNNNATISINDFKPNSKSECDIRNYLRNRYASIEEYGKIKLDYFA